MKKSKVSPIAVDFGGAAIKLLQLVPDEPARVVAAAAKAMPAELGSDAEARARFLTKTLKELHREGGFRGRRVTASIPAPLTFVRHVRIPAGQQEDTAQQVRDALTGQLPMDPAKMVVRHIDVGPVTADGAARREVICMAVARQAVMHHIQILKKAGLNPVGIHSEPAAIGQAFADLFRRNDDGQRTVFFVDIGLHVTKAVISHGGDIAFAKLVQLGGEHMDRHFAEELGVEIEEARQRRREQAAVSYSEDQPTPAHPQGGSRAADPTAAGLDEADENISVLEAFEPTRRAPAVLTEAPTATRHETIPAGGEALDCLIDELQLCVGYHQSVFDDRPIEQIVFLGGEAHQSAMCQRIAQALRLPARTADPLGRLGRDPAAKPPVGVDLRQPQPAWALPLGLCRLPSNL